MAFTSRAAYRRHLRALFASLPAAPPGRRENWFSRNKDALSAVQSLVTIIALLLAFVWFQGQHEAAPRLKIEQAFSQRPFLGPGHAQGEVLLAVQVWVTNVGSVSLYLDPGRIRVDEVNPEAAQLYCETMVDTVVAGTCNQPHPPAPWGTRATEWLRRSTAVGWFWRPTRSSRWIEPGERDEAYAGSYRLDDSTRTVRVSSIFSSGGGAYWKAVDYYDLLAPEGNSKTQATSKRGR